jgi:hypothetical protein
MQRQREQAIPQMKIFRILYKFPYLHANLRKKGRLINCPTKLTRNNESTMSRLFLAVIEVGLAKMRLIFALTSKD